MTDPLASLDRLAASLAMPAAETPACASIWPLLAVPDRAITRFDRTARDGHLASCARCRIAAVELWLDDGAAPEVAPMPIATALPPLPARRRSRRSLYAGLVAGFAAAAAVAGAAVAPMLRSGPSAASMMASAPLPLKPFPTAAPPLDLVVLVDAQRAFLGRGQDRTFRAVASALDDLKTNVPPDTRVTLVTATGDAMTVRAREVPVAAFSATTLGAMADYADVALSPRYDHVLDGVAGLFTQADHRRAVLVLGSGCDATTGSPAVAIAARNAALERLDLAGIAVGSVTYWNGDVAPCPEPAILRMGTLRSHLMYDPSAIPAGVSASLRAIQLPAPAAAPPAP
ncbi:MAG: hypothetical protein K8W52_18620 [Deltaproteobacteria bacterium]|nr:hypothetical protein [Deltaproteobacteria bacterium]